MANSPASNPNKKASDQTVDVSPLSTSNSNKLSDKKLNQSEVLN